MSQATPAGPVGDLELLEELVLGSARGGRKVAAPLVVSKVRELTEEDVPALLAPPPVASKPKAPAQLRHSHHQIARLIAGGKPQEEIALITGYSTSYISSLKGGQDFQELLAYYKGQKDMVFVDAMERLKIFGLSCLDELQKRFEETPEAFTQSQLMELMELSLLKPAKAQAEAAAANRPAGAPVSVTVQFIKSAEAETPAIEAPAGQVLEVMPKLVGVR